MERYFLDEGLWLQNRYKIQNKIGSGGFGITYRAYDKREDEKCCIKELYPRDIVHRDNDGRTLMPISNSGAAMMEHCIKRFGEEAGILQKLEFIEGVVNVYDLFYENDTCYFVMEFLEGGTLRDLMLNQGGRLELKVVSEIVNKTGKILAEVHNNGIFHRDIAPDNIFITEDGKIKLIDFGNAKHLVKQYGQINSVVLKERFSPPEQYSTNGKQGTWTDVYAFAFTAYYALTGIKPPGAFDRREEEYEKLDKLGYSKELSEVIDRAVCLDYRERTQTIDAFLKEFNDAYNKKPFISSTEEEFDSTWIPKPKIPLLEVYVNDVHQGAYRIPADKTITIGRNAEFRIFEKHVSENHCDLIYLSEDHLFCIVDHSRNGSRINGSTRLKEGIEAYAAPGDKVELGSKRAYIILKEVDV